ncbi:MAG: DNA polymerase IV [Christensenellaceae bacterium]|nr:DNA polymerase IV [Christensenellaceae bacterium]
MPRNFIKNEKVREIAHIDMNNFFASVECMLDVNLKDKAVAVCGSVEERHGIVLAKNYIAKRYGVQTGEPVWRAKQRCRDLVIVPPHYDEYIKYSHLAKCIYDNYTDRIEPYGIDECWVDLTHSTKLFGSSESICNEIRQRIKDELRLTVSIGLSFNKVFAKLGSDMKKPDALTVIPFDSFREKIWKLPVSDLLGVGRKTNELLFKYGINTIGDLAQIDVEQLVSRLKSHAYQIHSWANGLDYSEVTHKDYIIDVKSVSHGTTTKEDLTNNSGVWLVILWLCQKVSHKLIAYKKKAAEVGISVKDNTLYLKQWQRKLNMPTLCALTIAKAIFALFLKSYDWCNNIRAITVYTFDLIEDKIPFQIDFFNDVTIVDKHERISIVIDKIREKFGNDIIKNACLYQKSPNIKLTNESVAKSFLPTGLSTMK